MGNTSQQPSASLELKRLRHGCHDANYTLLFMNNKITTSRQPNYVSMIPNGISTVTHNKNELW